jgi:hypothetical protein
MADGTILNAGSGGDTIQTEDFGAAGKIPRSKLVLGAVDVDGGDVSATNPMPVAPQTLQVTGTGVNNGDTPTPATDVGSYRWVSLQLQGSGATIAYEQSDDNSNWYSLNLQTYNAGGFQSSGGSNTIVFGPIASRYFRARISSGGGSGTVTATAWFSANPGQFQLIAMTAPTNGVSIAGGSGDGKSDAGFGWQNANGQVPYAGVAPFALNGVTWDRLRNNNDVTALSSAARTATTSSADQTNYNARGLAVFLNVTAASGSGGLQVRVQGKDPVSGNYFNLNAAPTAITATGQYAYALYPGAATAAGDVQQTTQQVLPRTFRITVTHGDGSSYTYSVGYSLIL